MKRIGLDVGNGSIGMVVLNEQGKFVEDTYPSVYGGYSSVEHVSVGNKKQPSQVYTYQERDYVLGYQDVQLAGTTAISSYDRQQRLYRKEFQTLTKLALLDAATKDGSNGVIEVELSLGTPNEDYREEQVEILKKWFREPVTGAKDGESVVVMVKHVDVLSQPIGVLVDSYYDENGLLTDTSLDESESLVIDSGSGTLDMTHFHGTALIKQSSEPVGMNDVYQLMIEAIEKEQPKFRVDAYDLEHQLREQDGKANYTYKYGPFEMDVTSIRKDAMDQTWERMIGAVTRRFPDRMKFHRIILAGGTGDAFSSYFTDWMDTILLRDKPQLAVAWGLLKFLLANAAAEVTTE